MKDIKDKLQEYYNKINNIFNTSDTPKLLHKKNILKRKEDEQLLTGVIVVLLIIIIISSTGYYLLVFSPQQEEIKNIKQEKINMVNTLLNDDENHNKEIIIAEIDSKNTKEELENMDIESMIYPLLKNSLLEQLNQYKDKYNRIEIVTDNTTDIMNINNATNYINTRDVPTLSTISVKPVDSIILPLSITRKQAASGLITEGDTVDIYKSTNIQSQEEETENNTTITEKSTSKIVGGSHVVSILRSKDSGSIDQSMQLSQSPKSRNLSQQSVLDIQEVMSSKAAGTYDEKQLKILIEDYGTRLANYERTSRLGELDVEYIIMLEVPRDSVEDLINNMDNIILTIPTYDAPSWVKL